jgi:hypothetical protein
MTEINTTAPTGAEIPREKRCSNLHWTITMLQDDHERRLKDMTKKLNALGPFFGVKITVGECDAGESMPIALIAMFCCKKKATDYGRGFIDHYMKHRQDGYPNISIDITDEPPFSDFNYQGTELFGVTYEQSWIRYSTLVELYNQRMQNKN